ncbi:hypothetical protein NE237_032342 [Protea cynaroides]|uniref:Uncharacterized protein n=1 Tax=Protea cynaroides TaxID=273540 RepID=A0A9Q0R302_9MAGN|nr:hypothetical protein NE237_032342 [Protea cynaroides]
MPIFGKKRRENKKKKGRAANSHSTTNAQQVSGNGDLKTYDKKDSDVGKISPPKSKADLRLIAEDQEQAEVDREGRDSHPSASVVIANSKSMEASQNGAGNGDAESNQMEVQEEVEVVRDIKVTGELKPEESEIVKDIQVTRELKPDKDSESRDVNIESGGLDIETVPDVNSEGKLVEEKSVDSVTDTVPDVDLSEKSEEEKSVKAAPAVDSGEPVVSMTEEVIQDSVSATVVGAGVSSETDLASKDKEETSLPLSSVAAGASDEVKILQSSDVPIVDTSGSGGAEISRESAIPESSENQPLLDKTREGHWRFHMNREMEFTDEVYGACWGMDFTA